MKTTLKTASALASAVLLATPLPALACEKCFGAGGEAEGITLAMLALIAMTLVVWGGIGAFFINMRKRARRFEPGDLVVTEYGTLLAPSDEASRHPDKQP